MGLGTDELGEIPRPRLHKCTPAYPPPSAFPCVVPVASLIDRFCSFPFPGFEEGIAEGRFGAKGRGIEGAYAGGMHTLVVDESGKVSFSRAFQIALSLFNPSLMMRCSFPSLLSSHCISPGLVMGCQRQRLPRPHHCQRS